MFKCDWYPRLDTYEKAVAHFNAVKPMARGDCKGFKPIHLRSHYYKYDLIMMDGDAVVLTHHYSPNLKPEREALDNYVVKWLPNGEIHVRAPTYNCVQDRLSSLLFLNFFRHQNAIWVNTHQTYRLRKDEPNLFKRDSSGNLQLTNPESRSKMLLKRAEANNVRARYGDFRKYLIGHIKLRDEGAFTLQELLDMFGAKDGVDTARGWWEINTPTSLRSIRNVHNGYARSLDRSIREEVVTNFLELVTSGDPEKYYRASLWLMHSASEYTFGSTRRVTTSAVLKLFDEVLFLKHKDEVFYKKVLAHNDMSRDAWGWVFK